MQLDPDEKFIHGREVKTTTDATHHGIDIRKGSGNPRSRNSLADETLGWRWI
jgi:hypothetical protein